MVAAGRIVGVQWEFLAECPLAREGCSFLNYRIPSCPFTLNMSSVPLLSLTCRTKSSSTGGRSMRGEKTSAWGCWPSSPMPRRWPAPRPRERTSSRPQSSVSSPWRDVAQPSHRSSGFSPVSAHGYALPSDHSRNLLTQFPILCKSFGTLMSLAYGYEVKERDDKQILNMKGYVL